MHLSHREEAMGLVEVVLELLMRGVVGIVWVVPAAGVLQKWVQLREGSSQGVSLISVVMLVWG